MNRIDIVKALAKENHVTQDQAAEFLDSFLDLCKVSLMNGEKVLLTNFGVFDIKLRKARNSFDFARGETKVTPPKKVVVFAPAESFSKDIERGADE